MKVQYTLQEINNLIQNKNFLEITFDIDNLKKKTSRIELIGFGKKIKFELMYINKKYNYLYDDIIDPIILQIFNVNNELMSTVSIEDKQDLLFLAKQVTNEYDDLILIICPKNKQGMEEIFGIDTLKNFSFLLFKVN